MSRLKMLRLAAIAVIALGSSASPAAASDENVCIGGGPGATSCSVTVAAFSCSVTCGAGYACCGPTGCHCIAQT
jgi:hypothetical protein